MDVETALRQIDEANNKHVGGRDDYEPQRESYREALEEVERLAGGSAVEDLAGKVAEYIRGNEERPSASKVREDAAEIIERSGESVPDDSPLAGE